jgi:hypothetical protein
LLLLLMLCSLATCRSWDDSSPTAMIDAKNEELRINT